MTVRKLLPRFMFVNFIEDLIRCARAEISIGVINSRFKSVSTPTPCGLTNNDCERVIREVVIHRKIRGLLRNGRGMRMFGNIMTVMMHGG